MHESAPFKSGKKIPYLFIFKWSLGCMLPCSMYLIFLLARNCFSSLLTLNAFRCNWLPLGMIEEIITSHYRFKFSFTSTARSIILVSISVGVESLLRSFVQVCIMTTSAFAFSLLAVWCSASYHWQLLQGTN